MPSRPKRFPVLRSDSLIGVKTFSVVGDLHDHRAIESLNVYIRLAGVRMAGDVG